MIETSSTLTIRRLGEADAASVARLAGLDSGSVAAGPLLGAEVEGTLLAAISLRSGELVADPFSRTDELSAMLRLRASQMREREPKPRGRLLRQPRRAPLADPAARARDGLLSLRPRAF